MCIRLSLLTEKGLKLRDDSFVPLLVPASATCSKGRDKGILAKGQRSKKEIGSRKEATNKKRGNVPLRNKARKLPGERPVVGVRADMDTQVSLGAAIVFKTCV